MELGGQNGAGGGNSSLNSAQEQEIHRDHHEHHMEKASGSRSVSYYECTFCKRGFNNAQALGGHMNIHRKDKSKVKPKLPKSKPSPHQTSMNKNFPTHIPPPPTFSRAIFGSGESSLYNSQMCYYSPLTPSLHAFNPNPNPTTQLGFHGCEPGFNLNLQIGSSRKYGDHDEQVEDADESDMVDLELRLGRPPRR